jgi:hypothetical protein
MTNLSSNKKAFIRLMTKDEDHARRGFQLLLKRGDFADFFDALKADGLFDKSHNSGPIPVPQKENSYTVPFWEALLYLCAVARKAGEINSIPLANKVLEIVREVSNEKVGGKPKDNYHTWRTFTEIISDVPTDAVKNEDIDFLSVWLQSDFSHGSLGHVIGSRLLPKWLSSEKTEHWDKACRVLDHCLAVKWESKRGANDDDGQPVSVIEDYWLKELQDHNIAAFGNKCPENSLVIYAKRLSEVFAKIEKNVPSWSSRPAIEDHSQNYSWHGVENCLVEGVRDILEIWLEGGDEKARFFTSKLLDGKLEMERRIAIYLVNKKFEKLSGLLGKAIPLLLNTGHIHEMYNLLQTRYAEFDDANKKLTLDTIKNIPKPNKEYGDEILRRNQRNWLSAIYGKGLIEADQLFEKLNADPKLGKLSTHPDFISWMESRMGPGPSLYSSAELISLLDKGELIQALNNFQPSNDFWMDAPTIKALVDSLEEAVVKEPIKFSYAINDFLNAKRPYQYAIISGFMKFWGSEKEVGDEWKEICAQLFKFLETLLYNEAYWKEAVEKQRNLTPTKDWMTATIADLLRAFVRKDEKSISPEFLPQVQKLIFTLVEKNPSEWNGDNNDAMTQAINTLKGKAIEALIDYSLFSARLSDRKNKEHKTAWKEVEPIFNSQIRQCKGSNQEFSTLLGAYSANILYLDPEWLQNNIGLIFPIEYPDNFSCAIGGLAYAPANDRLYALLKNSGIIKAALEAKLEGRHARENLIERIMVAYVWSDETLESERIGYLFSPGNVKDLYWAVRFLWSVRGQKLERKHVERVLAFWEAVIKWTATQKGTSEAFESLLSMAALLSSYLEKINSNQKQWLMISIPYIAKRHNTDLFIQELSRLVDTSPEAVKDIFIKLFETYVPYYDLDGTLRSTISKLATEGYKVDMIGILEKLHNVQGFQEFYAELMSQK